MRLVNAIPITLLCLAVIFSAQTAKAAESQEEAILAGQAAVEQAAIEAGAAGKKAEEWARERQALLDEARQLIFDAEATRFAADRQEAYVTTQQNANRELQNRLKAASDTRQGLAPVTEALYDELAGAIAADLPFAVDERRARLIRVRRTLDDPDATAGDKIASLLVALRIEAEYGLAMEAEDVIADVSGTPMALTMLRVGRLALLRFPASGAWVERYDRRSTAWTRLDEAPARELLKAVQISRKRRIAELVALPVGSHDTLPDEEDGQ